MEQDFGVGINLGMGVVTVPQSGVSTPHNEPGESNKNSTRKHSLVQSRNNILDPTLMMFSSK